MKKILFALLLLAAINCESQSIIGGVVGGFRKKKAEKMYAQAMEKQRISDSIDEVNKHLAIIQAWRTQDSLQKMDEAQREFNQRQSFVYDSIQTVKIDSVAHVRDSTETAERIIQDKKDQEDQKIYNKAILKKYGTYYGKLILNNKVVIGMTESMCEEAWGTPDNTSETMLDNITIDSWFYSGENYGYSSLSFKNGKLFSFTK